MKYVPESLLEPAGDGGHTLRLGIVRLGRAAGNVSKLSQLPVKRNYIDSTSVMAKIHYYVYALRKLHSKIIILQNRVSKAKLQSKCTDVLSRKFGKVYLYVKNLSFLFSHFKKQTTNYTICRYF